MGNFYKKIDTTLTNFARGIVSRLDRRDAAEDSLKDCVGFNLSEVAGMLKKDYGSSPYVSLPGILDIVCFDVLRIESLATDFMLVVGTDASGIPHWYVRKYYDLESRGGVVDEWVELTEKLSGTIATKPNDVSFTSAVLSTTVANDYYVGWVAINTTRGEWAYIADYVASTKTCVVDEDRPSWAASDSVLFYRFPDVYALEMDAGDAIIDPRQSWFRTNTVGDRMAIGYQRNPGASGVPMALSLVQQQWFYGGLDFLSPKYNKLYFARETPNHNGLESHGLSATLEVPLSNRIIPQRDLWVDNSDMVNGGDGWGHVPGGPSGGPPTDLYVDIDDGDVPNYSDSIVAVLTGTYEAAVYTVGMNGHDAPQSIPASGMIYFTVRARAETAESGGSLILQIVQYENPPASPSTPYPGQITLVGAAEKWGGVGNQWYDYTIGRTIEELGITGNVYLGLQITATKSRWRSSWWVNVVSVNESMTTQMSAATIRLAFLPQYDGYMLGRPVVKSFPIQSSSVARYCPRLGVEFARMDKRLTDIFIFSDDGDETRIVGDFRSAWEVKLTSREPNKAGAPFNIISTWNSTRIPTTGTGTVAIDTTVNVVGTGTRFLSEINVGDMMIAGAQPRRVVTITNDTQLAVHSGFAGVLTGQTFMYYDPQRRYLTQSALTVSGSNRPILIPLGRSVTGLLTLSEFIGYGISKEAPSIATNWRFQVQAAFGQTAQVVCDESDTVLRRTHYSELTHNDRSFPQVRSDIDGNPIMLFLATKGELMGIFGQLGNLYIYKPTSVTVIDGTTTESHVFVADVISKHGIIQTPTGIIHAGLHGVYVYPNHGGLEEDITAAIREDYAAISKTRKQNIVMGDCPSLGVMLMTIPTTDTPSQYDSALFETWIYHYETGIWWKRRFERVPLRYTKLYDNTLVFSTIRNGEQGAGSGTITASGTDVHGSGTSFLTQGRVGWLIKALNIIGQIVGYRRIVSITDDDDLVIDSAFSSSVTGAIYYFVSPRAMKYPDRSVYTDDGEGVYWRIETQWMQLGTPLQKVLNTILIAAQDADSAAIPYKVSVYFDRIDVPFCSIKSATLGSSSRFSESVINALKPNSFKEIKLVIERDDAYTQLQATGKFDISELRLTGESHSTGKDY